MSNQKQNLTMKFTDVVATQINIESVKIGKDKVPLLRYGSDKKNLFIQGPWIKMRQYGVPPGEMLKNGKKNDYYQNEEQRKSLRIPVDKVCCVQTNSEQDNSDEIELFITKMKEIDNHIKNSPVFMTSSDIDLDNKEKYNNIYRKPIKSKKVSTTEPKEKYYSMKFKFDVENSTGKIRTEFISINPDTNEKTIANKEDGSITIDEIDKLISYNSEVQPLFQLVKIWSQDKGDWGVTLKLKKCRVKKQVYVQDSKSEFLDSDEDSDTIETVVPTKTSKQTSEPVKTQPEEKQETKKTPVKQVVQADSEDDSDDESDDDVIKPVTKNIKQPVKKMVASDDESDEDTKKKQQKAKAKSKKATA
jgi:hypothetical protein